MRIRDPVACPGKGILGRVESIDFARGRPRRGQRSVRPPELDQRVSFGAALSSCRPNAIAHDPYFAKATGKAFVDPVVGAVREPALAQVN
jgi:hypothetical protein